MINKIYIKDIVGIYKESELKKESEEDGENENKLKEENKELYEKLAAVMDERDKLRYKIKDKEGEIMVLNEILKNRNKDAIYEISYVYSINEERLFKGKISSIDSFGIDMEDSDKKVMYALDINNIKNIKYCGINKEDNSLSIENKEKDIEKYTKIMCKLHRIMYLNEIAVISLINLNEKENKTYHSGFIKEIDVENKKIILKEKNHTEPKTINIKNIDNVEVFDVSKAFKEFLI